MLSDVRRTRHVYTSDQHPFIKYQFLFGIYEQSEGKFLQGWMEVNVYTQYNSNMLDAKSIKMPYNSHVAVNGLRPIVQKRMPNKPPLHTG